MIYERACLYRLHDHLLAFTVHTDVLVLQGSVQQLRQSIQMSIQQSLRTMVKRSCPYGSFHLAFPGVRPCSFASLFDAFLEPEFDHLAFAATSAFYVNIPPRAFLACVDHAALESGCLPDWCVQAGTHGRHVWVSPFKRHHIRVSFIHDRVTEIITHANCPKCNFQGHLDGEFACALPNPCMTFNHGL